MKRMLFFKVTILPLLVAVMIIMTISSFPGLTQDQSELTDNEAKTEGSTVEITADQVNYDKENNQMIFIGNVIIIQEDTTLAASQASFNVDTKIGQISENIKMIQDDITITGQELKAFLNDKHYIFKDQVELLQERTNDAGEEDNITWLCQQLEIFTDSKNMTATGEVVINKKDYTITAQEAIYNDEEDKVSLSGQVKIEEIENNRQISGERAVFYIENDKLEVSGNVRSNMILD